MKKYILAVFCVVVLSGCDFNFNMLPGVTQKVNENAESVGSKASDVFDLGEKYLGKEIITNETAEKGENVASKTTDIANKVGAGTEAISNFIPEEYQKYTEGASGVAYLIGALGAAAAAFFRKQKKEEQKAKEVVLVAVNNLPNAGETITKAAKVAGVSENVEKSYLGLVQKGEIDIQS